MKRVNVSPRQGSLSRLLVTKSGAIRHEIDFVVGDPLMGEAYQLVQVSWGMSNEKTRAREILGLRAGMRSLGVPEGWTVTMDEEDEVAFEGGVVHIVPAWKWLLD
ncbi:hypothetical protein [Collinsella tanakaei]|uniref:hypothetical protein n=1 Tax=Collinsella tanakaei TaxID=626935 RepID=UPI0022E04106|nr:hypothetical protein [Collinsella tanakaei]